MSQQVGSEKQGQRSFSGGGLKLCPELNTLYPMREPLNPKPEALNRQDQVSGRRGWQSLPMQACVQNPQPVVGLVG